jgi:hypothetical protein
MGQKQSEGIMGDHDIAALLSERMKEIAREVFQEITHAHVVHSRITDDAPAKLREQLAFIKAKEHVTVKEAALLLSCSESHVRKLVKLARKGKSCHPIPFVHMEGVTVFPVCNLLDWARPKQKGLAIYNDLAIQNEAA